MSEGGIRTGEITAGRISLEDGECVFYQQGEIQKERPKYGHPYVGEDEFAIGKNGPLLEANAVDCRIVVLYENTGKYGAVIHVGAEDLNSNRHGELIDLALRIVPELSESRAYVLGDTDSSDPGIQRELRGDRKRWNERIAEYLRRKDVKDVRVLSDGEGKDATLDTKAGTLKVLDNEGKVLLEEEMV